MIVKVKVIKYSKKIFNGKKGSMAVEGKRFLESNASSILGTLT